jgi:hypothetical protein
VLGVAIALFPFSPWWSTSNSGPAPIPSASALALPAPELIYNQPIGAAVERLRQAGLVVAEDDIGCSNSTEVGQVRQVTLGSVKNIHIVYGKVTDDIEGLPRNSRRDRTFDLLFYQGTWRRIRQGVCPNPCLFEPPSPGGDCPASPAVDLRRLGRRDQVSPRSQRVSTAKRAVRTTRSDSAPLRYHSMMSSTIASRGMAEPRTASSDWANILYGSASASVKRKAGA